MARNAWLELAPRSKQQQRDAEAYDCVQRIMQNGCHKKTAAVAEAAKALRRSESSIWVSLKEHKMRLFFERHGWRIGK
jgi:hypothetical protein